MRNYKYNWGNYLIIRWFIASWLLHGVHVLDKTEKLYYIISEIIIQFIPLIILYICNVKQWWIYLISIFIIHTITWLCDSHWLVGYREVNKRFQSNGIQGVINYIHTVKKELAHNKNIALIALYGSLSRKMFHNRSDLDLRIVQEGRSFLLFLKIQKLRFIGIWKYKIPLDLKLVDSENYLKKEMRKDEKAVIVYKKYDRVYNEGVNFEEIERNPMLFLKKKNNEYK